MSTLLWHPLASDSRVGDPAADAALDPYFWWELKTSYAHVPDPASQPPWPVPVPGGGQLPVREPSLPFIVETQRVVAQAPLGEWFRCGMPTRYPTRFHTGFVRLSKLPLLREAMTLKDGIARFQLAAPRVRHPPDPPYPGLKPRLTVLQQRVATLGVIDDGCCMAHRNLWSRSGNLIASRLRYVWDQRGSVTQPAPPWQRFETMGEGALVLYGEEMSAQSIGVAIDSWLNDGKDERAFYADKIHRAEWPDRGRTHGAAVLQILAGHGGHLGLQAQAPASDSPIVFVQLPARTAGDASGGSLGFYVIDGARYIVQRAREAVAGGGEWEATINISLGSIAGPHDGTTMTEQALDELVDQYPPDRVRLVMAAGNTGRRRIHAHAHLGAGQTRVMSVMVPPAQADDSFVEIWLPAAAQGHDVSLTVRPPGGIGPVDLAVGQAQALKTSAGAIVACVIAARKVAQGRNGTMALLALRGTAAGAASAPYGVWHVSVHTSGSAVIDAWVERHETIIGRRSGQRTHFVSSPASADQPFDITDDTTLSSIAHGNRVTVVGGYDRRAKQVTDTCAQGPIRGSDASAQKPDVYAPSTESPWLRGVRVPGFYSGAVSRISGTSAAAPRYAHLLARGALAENETPVEPYAEPGYATPASTLPAVD